MKSSPIIQFAACRVYNIFLIHLYYMLLLIPRQMMSNTMNVYMHCKNLLLHLPIHHHHHHFSFKKLTNIYDVQFMVFRCICESVCAFSYIFVLSFHFFYFSFMAEKVPKLHHFLQNYSPFCCEQQMTVHSSTSMSSKVK